MNKKWIKYLGKTSKTYTQGTAYEVDAAVADALIEAGQAEATEAPLEVKTVEQEVSAALDDRIATAVAKGFEALKKEMAPARRETALTEDQAGGATEKTVIPATVKRWSALKNFTAPRAGMDAEVRAFRFGQFLLSCYGNANARKWCAEHGVELKTARENNNSSAAFLVPDEFQNDLIDLREKFGVFRQNAKVVPMASDTRSDPRRVNGLTASFVGESTAASLSDKAWDRVRLTAKKIMVLTKYSTELSEDAVLNVADDLAGEIAYAFAMKEDQCGFTGDGTSTYGGIVGVTNALVNVGGVGGTAGLIVSTGTGFATNYNGITLADFNRVVATLPEYADVPGQAKWYCSKFFWGSVMQKLAVAAGGNRVADVEGGALRKSFLGYDVVISQVMPKISAINQVACVFGNLALAARIGTRRDTTIQMSEHALNAFEQDEIVIRGTERFDIVVHDCGDPTAGPAKSAQAGITAGPIVGLVTSGT